MSNHALQPRLCGDCKFKDFNLFFGTHLWRIESQVNIKHLMRSDRADCCICEDFFAIFDHFAKRSSGTVKGELALDVSYEPDYSYMASIPRIEISGADEHT